MNASPIETAVTLGIVLGAAGCAYISVKIGRLISSRIFRDPGYRGDVKRTIVDEIGEPSGISRSDARNSLCSDDGDLSRRAVNARSKDE
jgi:hypothetical protein